jgi:hypothetical protein
MAPLPVELEPKRRDIYLPILAVPVHTIWAAQVRLPPKVPWRSMRPLALSERQLRRLQMGGVGAGSSPRRQRRQDTVKCSPEFYTVFF